MLCGYNCQPENNNAGEQRCCDGFSRCMNGIMILVGIIAGLVFAAAVVLLFINSLVTAFFPAVLTALITGIVLLISVLVLSLADGGSTAAMRCLRCKLGGLLFGIVGTILTSFIAVSADLTVVSVTSGVLLGLVAFFFAYMIVSLLFTAFCATKN